MNSGPLSRSVFPYCCCYHISLELSDRSNATIYWFYLTLFIEFQFNYAFLRFVCFHSRKILFSFGWNTNKLLDKYNRIAKLLDNWRPLGSELCWTLFDTFFAKLFHFSLVEYSMDLGLTLHRYLWPEITCSTCVAKWLWSGKRSHFLIDELWVRNIIKPMKHLFSELIVVFSKVFQWFDRLIDSN